MGEYFLERMLELKDKHTIIGDVRGRGLFLGAELVEDRKSKKPVSESVLVNIVGDCMRQGVMIGRTNRSLGEFNNTLTFSPALIATKEDINEIVTAVDNALGRCGLR